MFRSVIILTAILLAGLQAETPVIDLTAVVARNRVREPTTSSTSGGGVGGNGAVAQGKNPLAMTLIFVKVDRSSEDSIIFAVELNNIGSRKIEVPVNPNLADFEPEDPSAPYAYVSCYVTLRLDGLQEDLQGVSLYGSKWVTGSMKELGPGEMLQLRARAVRRRANSSNTSQYSSPNSPRVTAVLLLQQNFVRERNGILHQDSRQIAPQLTSSNVVYLSFAP